ncbi:hypothetical protein IWQ62_000643 [Dispira parvispora]|uniref:Dolichol-phosphate mannosyltransferase subunit 3 n=1 Tax=Dispira parvispora TaxID=1520584 RepID=A0A9W8AU98_9FUNG|nr:hypothetical protein IWQ62_000643 [Dispira parvispora]
MSRATHIIGLAGTLMGVWLLVLIGWLPLPLSDTVRIKVWPTLPFEFLVALGAYMLGSVGYGLLKFRDCPEAHQELLQEISMAKVDLRQNGVI